MTCCTISHGRFICQAKQRLMFQALAATSGAGGARRVGEACSSGTVQSSGSSDGFVHARIRRKGF